MEATFTTPFLDLFQRDDVDREIRMLAARGALAPRAHEQVRLLMLLVSDSDAGVAATAEATLQAIPIGSLAQFLAGSESSDDIRAFFSARGIEPAEDAGASGGIPLVGAEDAAGQETEEEEDERSLLQRLSSMTVAQKVIRAMKGSREERALLIRDPNRLVSTAVLSSPKLTETEVEAIARMANVSEDVLRIIGRTRAWMKSYAVMAALARNPKTPVAMSMNLLPRLTDKDVRMISTDRNVPEVLRASARRKTVNDR